LFYIFGKFYPMNWAIQRIIRITYIFILKI